MKIALLHNAVEDGAAPDVADVLVQARAIENALAELSHVTRAIEFGEEAVTRRALEKAELVVNLVEGSIVAMTAAARLLEDLGISFTGSGSRAIAETSDKRAAKRLMRHMGLPTPRWAGDAPSLAALDGGPVIVKSAVEHASVGIDAASVVASGDRDAAATLIESRREALGDWIAEEYVDGREFNLSLLMINGTVRTLPPAEIVFDGFPASRPRIVDYRAKWDESSFEHAHTRRTFDFAVEDRAILDELARLARRCWELFGLRGFARVDFRVDEDNRPWILEVNANPCLSPDSGFVAAAARSGLDYVRLVEAIIAAA